MEEVEKKYILIYGGLSLVIGGIFGFPLFLLSFLLPIPAIVFLFFPFIPYGVLNYLIRKKYAVKVYQSIILFIIYVIGMCIMFYFVPQ